VLTVTLFLSALMGIVQESLCREYGKHPHEAMYYNVYNPTVFPFFFFPFLLQ
jgi:UDP-xylose/UDP-N-acetylglucosamine transporter B4